MGAVERALHSIVNVGGDGLVAPEPAHHLRENRSQHLLTMELDAPAVVHVVALFGKRLLHAHVLIEPVPALIVSSVRVQAPVVIAAIHKKHANGLLFAPADDIRVSIAATDIREAADIAQHLSKVPGPFPRYGERRNGSGTRPTDAVPFGIP